MESVAKEFTIIDFLGIFLPGAIFVLTLQFYLRTVTIPFEYFFGENAVMLSVYFVILSYLCGSFLHQVGAVVEKLLVKIFLTKSMHKKHWDNKKVKALYQSRINPKLPNGDLEEAEAGKQIFHYIQRKHRPQRILIFHAFFTMSRTLVMTFAAITAIEVFYFPHHWRSTLGVILVCGVLSILNYNRWKDFEQKCIDEAYLLFVCEDTSTNG